MGALVDTKRSLATAWQIIDGTDGAAAPRRRTGAHRSACGYRRDLRIEHVNAYNADVASPVEVEEFWAKHGALPGFAVGT